MPGEASSSPVQSASSEVPLSEANAAGDKKGTGGPSRGSLANVPAPRGCMSCLPCARRAEEMSADVPSWVTLDDISARGKRGIWAKLGDFFRDPVNFTLVLWTVVMAIPFGFVVLLNLGAFNASIPDPATRQTVSEYMNVALAALYSVLCFGLSVVFTHQTVRLVRWRPDDIRAMRTAYCKSGTRKPFEWAHMCFVVANLQLMCLACYGYSILFFVDVPTQEHKVPFVSLLGALSFIFPIIAGLYQALSPLSKSYPKLEIDPPAEGDAGDISTGSKSKRAKASKANDHVVVVERPEWDGNAVLGFCRNPKVAALSCFCSCCTLGVNLERLGLGHAAVQGSLLAACTVGPIFVFELAAHMVKSTEAMKHGLAAAGVACGLLGFIFGGVWRIQMRKAFGLPGSRWGCGLRCCSDLLLWVFCWPCALSQEVRTADTYQVRDGKMVSVESEKQKTGKHMMTPPPVQKVA